MIKSMDVLLRQWGQECAAPAVEASVRSPLGDTEQWMGGGRATGGSAGLGLGVAYAQRSRVYALVDEALRSMSSPREEGGLGGRGLALYTLAKVRYVHAGEQPSVGAQLAELKISERTYRTQVGQLHGWLLPRLEAGLRVESQEARKQKAMREEHVEQADAVRCGLSEREAHARSAMTVRRRAVRD